MKQVIIKKILPLFFVLFAVNTLSYGQYKGPGTPKKTYTVKEVISNASRLDRSDELVKLQGFIVKQVNEDTYIFKDRTGSITVEISRRRLPNVPFDDKTEVMIIGEVDKDVLESAEIEVKEMVVVTK